MRSTVGWECVHIAIDDCTPLAYAEVLEDEKATTVVTFLKRAIGFFQRHGRAVQQLLADNGSAYPSLVHAIVCRTLGIRHLRTRPYRPQTNGKACERFIRTLLGGWGHGAIFATAKGAQRPLTDGSGTTTITDLGHKPPFARLYERTNLLSTYSWPPLIGGRAGPLIWRAGGAPFSAERSGT